MVQVDLPASFTIGQIFSMLAASYLKNEKSYFANRLLGPLNFYLSCGYVPVGLFLLVAWPAWEVMYVTDWVEKTFNNGLVAGFYITFCIAMIILGNAGFILGHVLIKRSQKKILYLTISMGLFLTILPFLLRWGIWKNIGTYNDIINGTAYPFLSNPFFSSWLIIMLYMTFATIIAGFVIKKLSKKYIND